MATRLVEIYINCSYLLGLETFEVTREDQIKIILSKQIITFSTNKSPHNLLDLEAKHRNQQLISHTKLNWFFRTNKTILKIN